jgi:hypothetical protein
MTEYETKAGETTRVSVDERASTVQAQKSTFAFDRVFGQASLQGVRWLLSHSRDLFFFFFLFFF